MITPRFSCSQTATSVVVRIYVPAVRAADIELHVDGTLFSVHINPYFLRLVFPGEVVEDDTSSASYDPGAGYLTVTLSKACPGEEFKDLDVLAKLLAPVKHAEPAKQPLIEVLDSQAEVISDDLENEESIENLKSDRREILEAEQNDWQINQVPEDLLSISIKISTEYRYGFLEAYTGYFNHVAHTENEVNELGSEAEKLTKLERRAKRLTHENEKWDEEYYIADYADDEYVQGIMSYLFLPDAPCSLEFGKDFAFTDEENMTMLQLPRKEYLTDSYQKRNLYLTLLNILFSYTYDSRTTQRDSTPESAWTIATLTPAFSALDPPPYASDDGPALIFTPTLLKDTLVPSIRRSLAFPLFRSFALTKKCISDVSVMLLHGKRAVLRALLETKKILDHHEVYHVYSKVWVNDFCRWVASDADDGIFLEIGEKLQDLDIDKREIGWDLLALETAVRHQMGREADSDDETQAETETSSDAGSSPPPSSSSEESSSDSGLSESNPIRRLPCSESEIR